MKQLNKPVRTPASKIADKKISRNYAGDHPAARRVLTGGRTAVLQARLVLLVMINIAQLWILSATIEAGLASHYKQLMPLIIASGVCWLIAFTIFMWWKPVARRTRPREGAKDR